MIKGIKMINQIMKLLPSQILPTNQKKLMISIII